MAPDTMRSIHLSPRCSAVLTAVVVAALAAGCSRGPAGAGTVTVAGEQVPAAQLRAVAAGICAAAAQAPADPGEARRIFFGQSHDGIHTVARGLQGVDRSMSADLLVAKQVVEADLSSEPDGGQLAADLDRLAATTRSGLERLGLSVPACGPSQHSTSPGKAG